MTRHAIPCQKCGLVGCDCKSISDTFNAMLCGNCKSDPCTCKPLKRALDGVCTVCHRAACICISHRHVKMVADPGTPPDGTRRPYSDFHIESLVNQAMHHYYGRDAEGLAKWLRRALR